MNKFKLEIEYDYDFNLMGICCHEKDYRVAWALNNILKLELQKSNDLEIKEKRKTESSQFSFYSYTDEEAYMEYYMIANRSSLGLLIAEQKQVDYFLLIRGSLNSEQKEDMLKKVKKINIILTAYDIDPNELESKQNLLF